MLIKITKIIPNLNQTISNYIELQKIKKFILTLKEPYKLNVGCGKVKLEGWLNLDIENSERVADIVWNATLGFPFFEDNSCYLIYNEHFLEHLEVADGLNFLKDCYRILKHDGILRIAMPSLEYTVNKYLSQYDWKNQDWLTWPEHQFIKTRAEMINIAFRWWGHQWFYDREELYRRLHEAGFEKIIDMEWGNSKIPELRNLETRPDSLLIVEAYK